MNRKASFAVAALMLAAAPAWAQQQGVTRFDTPPSVEDLKKALGAQEAHPAVQAPESNPASPASPASSDEGGAAVKKPRTLRQIILKGPVSVEEAPLVEPSVGGGPPAVTAPAAVVPTPMPAAGDAAAAAAVPPASTGAAAGVAAPTVGMVAPTAAVTNPTPALGHAVALPVQFEFGSAAISTSSQAFIRVVGELLQQRPDLYLLIEGHTDAVGSTQTNMMLSWERAFSVFRALVEQYGIDPARLQPVGKGSTEPLPGLSPFDGLNRRVQFRVMG